MPIPIEHTHSWEPLATGYIRSDCKTRQKHLMAREIYTNSPHDCRCKILKNILVDKIQQGIERIIVLPSEVYSWNVRKDQYLKINQGEKKVIISVNAEKTFD